MKIMKFDKAYEPNYILIHNYEHSACSFIYLKFHINISLINVDLNKILAFISFSFIS